MSAMGLALGALALGPLGWGLTGAAAAVAIPLTLGKGVLTAVFACRALHVAAGEYMRRAFIGPLACTAPFVAALLVGRSLGHTPAQSLIAALLTGGAVLLPLYWRVALPLSIKTRIKRKLGVRIASGQLGVGPQTEKSGAQL
jgi:hypothetical protein